MDVFGELSGSFDRGFRRIISFYPSTLVFYLYFYFINFKGPSGETGIAGDRGFAGTPVS